MAEPLSPPSQRVLRFSVETSGSDGLRYEDYVSALSGPLKGIDFSALTVALHQLEAGGLVLPDPVGTPNRRYRLTPKGREVSLGSAAAPTPKEAQEEAADAAAPKLKPGGPQPPPYASTSSSLPATAPSEARKTNMEDGPKLSEQRDEESRKRLKLVIEREDAVRASEEKLRLEEKRLLGEEERMADMRKQFEKDKAEQQQRSEEARKSLEAEKTQLEGEKGRLRQAVSTMERHRIELDQKEQSIKTSNAQLDERTKASDAKALELSERDKALSADEDALHEHLSAVKGHLANVRSSEDGIAKVHEQVSSRRAKRSKPS